MPLKCHEVSNFTLLVDKYCKSEMNLHVLLLFESMCTITTKMICLCHGSCKLNKTVQITFFLNLIILSECFNLFGWRGRFEYRKIRDFVETLEPVCDKAVKCH